MKRNKHTRFLMITQHCWGKGSDIQEVLDRVIANSKLKCCYDGAFELWAYKVDLREDDFEDTVTVDPIDGYPKYDQRIVDELKPFLLHGRIVRNGNDTITH